MAFFSRKSHPACPWKLHENWRTALAPRSSRFERLTSSITPGFAGGIDSFLGILPLSF
jgi:hypothetical protein